MGITGWLRWGWRQLTSMRTALILLFLVALASVPGSLFPQRGQAPEKVAEYFENNPSLAKWLDRFSLFDVFAAPWFAAIYLLLFVSLAGCVLPRSWQLLQNIRSQPPVTPKNLGKLPQNASFSTDASPSEVLETARALLKKRRFRTVVGDGAVASEKGYLHETGNLVFHLALLALLFAIGAGSLFGYRGSLLVTEGTGFANSVLLYDEFTPGKLVDPDDLARFQMSLKEFKADYITTGDQMGQARDFSAKVTYTSSHGGAEKTHDLKVNHPLGVDGVKVYLLGHGYAPIFKVVDGEGNTAFDGPIPFLPQNDATLTSEGVIKVPDAKPSQLGFLAMFWPTAAASPDGKSVISKFPAPANPMAGIIGAFKGDLGLDTGNPQSVYRLDSQNLTRLKTEAKPLAAGETMKLPDGQGSITFVGYKQWVSLSVAHDPARGPALLAAIIAIAGLVVSFLIRRRRVWVRASAGEDGRTLVEVGGLSLGTPTAEFDDIVRALRPDKE